MRALFFSPKGTGHVNPTLPLVRGLVARGHEVTYCLTAEWRERLEAMGCRYRNMGTQEAFTTADFNPSAGFYQQLLPATAKDPNVDIPEIDKIENNIHAGTKYLRFMVNRYFDDPAIKPLDRMLFAFTSYNAGPNKLNQLRKIAAERGLDPNVWFRNVDLVVSEKIGRETMTYVSNIYKYYVAYQIALEQNVKKGTVKQAQGLK